MRRNRARGKRALLRRCSMRALRTPAAAGKGASHYDEPSSTRLSIPPRSRRSGTPIGKQTGLFRPERPDAEPFTIVNPPPNVTGSLHIGHALDNTLQDVVIRYERLRGKDALWVVGTDHAGHRHADGGRAPAGGSGRTSAPTTRREDFVDKVWEWKAESGGRSPASCAASAARWTGAASSSRWTRISPARW